MDRRPFNLILYFSIFLIVAMFTPILAQNPMNPRLKAFLNRQDFLELIRKYEMDTITLRWEGLIQDSLAHLDYQMKPGYRCQVFAGSIKENAEKITRELKNQDFSPVYLLKTPEGLYKVQVGDFKEREPAENLLLKLYKAGFKNTWLVQTDIRVPREEMEEPITSDSVESDEFSLFYGIQIFATREKIRAQALKARLQTQLDVPVRIIQNDQFYKVVIGKFGDRKAAEGLLSTLREKGFSDAWITQLRN